MPARLHGTLKYQKLTQVYPLQDALKPLEEGLRKICRDIEDLYNASAELWAKTGLRSVHIRKGLREHYIDEGEVTRYYTILTIDAEFAYYPTKKLPEDLYRALVAYETLKGLHGRCLTYREKLSWYRKAQKE